LQTASINSVTQWIVNGLWGGYTAPNLLKWHWYRFNGFGYFWGMVAGIASALALPRIAPDLHPLWGFPWIFLASILASVLGSLWTDPEPDAVLVGFYKSVRPWGYWGPVLKKVLAEDPSFRPNRRFGLDMANVAIAMIWQMTLVTIPLYMVLRDGKGFWISMLVLVVTSFVLKKTWLDKVEAS
jgi:SSS family solute:Na+ symporter